MMLTTFQALEHKADITVIGKLAEIAPERVREVGQDGNTPLHWALYFECKEEVIKYLVELWSVPSLPEI